MLKAFVKRLYEFTKEIKINQENWKYNASTVISYDQFKFNINSWNYYETNEST